MLLAYGQLKDLIRRGVITDVTEELINGTSIDVTLGSTILIEELPVRGIISLRSKDSMLMKPMLLTDSGYDLIPGEFILAHSKQVFNLPLDVSAEYKLKSSMARVGLEHLNAGWCDPGWHGSVLTLELINCSRFHTIRIRPGDRIGQVVFFEHDPVPETVSYMKRGRYNGDLSVSGAKKEKKDEQV